MVFFLLTSLPVPLKQRKSSQQGKSSRSISICSPSGSFFILASNSGPGADQSASLMIGFGRAKA
jgi:hypothetical protein